MRLFVTSGSTVDMHRTSQDIEKRSPQEEAPAPYKLPYIKVIMFTFTVSKHILCKTDGLHHRKYEAVICSPSFHLSVQSK